MMFRIAVCLLIGLLGSSLIYAQDTLITNYPNTQQRWEKVYEEEQKVAENIYHKNGAPWMTVNYDPKAVESWKWYYDNGNPYFEATIVDDLLQGRYQIWYANGQLAESLLFVDNLEDGPAEFYHPNGQLAMKGQYAAGKMIGTWQFFDANGQPPKGNWEWRFAASQQQIRMNGQFNDGRPTGSWTYRTTANQGRSTQQEFVRIFD